MARSVRSLRAERMPESPFATMNAAKIAARNNGLSVTDLSIGASDMPPPEAPLKAIAEAVWDPGTYTYSLWDSTRPLRDAATAWHARRYGSNLDPERHAIPLIGAQEGFANLLLATTDPGDTVLVTEPGYPNWFGAIAVAGVHRHPLPLTAANDFLPDLDAVPSDVAHAARLLVLSYPNNPTAGVATREFFADALAFCDAYDLLLVHDFPYVDMVFGEGTAPSALEPPGALDRTVELYSMSKSVHMSGFRAGFALGQPDALAALKTVKSAIDFNPWLGIQRAAVAALGLPRERIQQDVKRFEHRRDALLGALRDGGLDVRTPQAGMFVWAPLPQGWGDSTAFALDLVARTGVAVAPGVAFGPSGEGWMRLALVAEPARLAEAGRLIAQHRPT